MKPLLFVGTCFLMHSSIQAQDKTSYVDSLEAHKDTGGRNIITWRMKTEKDIGQIHLERSYDGINYLTSGVYFLDELNKKSYQFLDSSMADSAKCYRIVLKRSNDTIIDSSVVAMVTGRF